MKDGGSAFPILDRINDDNGGALVCIANGMTLRDYFAGQALAGLGAFYANQDNMEIKDVVEQCYNFADVMLTEREKRNGKDSC